MDFNAILAQFGLKGECSPYGDGHINETYLVVDGDKKYILQKINNHVFKNPDEVMENVDRVTKFLRKKIEAYGGDADRETLTLISTVDGKTHYTSDEGFFRVYKFIDKTTTYSIVRSAEDFHQAARAFGRFQKLLADFPAEQLHETIVDFHNTPARVQQLRDAIAQNKAGRLDSVADEIKFALDRAEEMGQVAKAVADGSIPLRVTHNDTKLNNVMIDDATGKAICVIDLDTVMPGSLLYDYGDSMRFGTNPVAEDEKDLSKVYCNLDLFRAYTEGFVAEMADTLTESEWKYLVFSARLLTYECGIRFLADYLNGDVYFRTHYADHNLDRCHTQFKLVADMESKEAEMQAIVDACRKA